MCYTNHVLSTLAWVVGFCQMFFWVKFSWSLRYFPWIAVATTLRFGAVAQGPGSCLGGCLGALCGGLAALQVGFDAKQTGKKLIRPWDAACAGWIQWAASGDWLGLDASVDFDRCQLCGEAGSTATSPSWAVKHAAGAHSLVFQAWTDLW